MWKVFTFILLGLLILMMLLSVSGFLFRLQPSSSRVISRVGPKLEEVVLEDNRARDRVAVVKIEGMISSSITQGRYTMVELIKAQLKEASQNPRVKAVILKVDSPGGEVLASDEINRLISDFQENSKKPVVASMGNLAASGGYYVSAPCRWIVANELTITGSIGVILHSWNYRGLMDKVGVAPQIYKSGEYKDMLSGARDPAMIPPEERKMVQALIDETYQKFREVVAAGREQAFLVNQKSAGAGRQLSRDWMEYADGRVLSGAEAFRLGFVDELGNFEDAVDRAKALAGITTADLIEYQQYFNFSDIFRLFGSSEPQSMKIDIGLEPPRLRAGQLYFLYELAN
jgi:protease IV